MVCSWRQMTTCLPDSLKGFAPVVRGIAKSNAQITIKQNGYAIYQTYVSPGAFEISDTFIPRHQAVIC